MITRVYTENLLSDIRIRGPAFLFENVNIDGNNTVNNNVQSIPYFKKELKALNLADKMNFNLCESVSTNTLINNSTNRHRNDLYDHIHSVIVQPWENEKVLLNIFSNSIENRDIILNRIVPPKAFIENLLPVRKFNSVLKLFQVTAFVIRFIENLKRMTDKQSIVTTPYCEPRELRNAKILCFKIQLKFQYVYIREGIPDICSPGSCSPGHLLTVNCSPDSCPPYSCSPDNCSPVAHSCSPDNCSPDSCSPDSCPTVGHPI